MQTIRIAAVSMNSPLGECEATMAQIDVYARQAVGDGAELVLFPELVVHGHCTPNTWELAESVPDGPSVQRLVELAREVGAFLSVGLSEKERDIVYNTQVLVGPEGYIGKQRKLHLSRDEGTFYKGGSDINVFDIGKCRVGTVICYDNQFPEVGRVAALRGAEVMLMPHAAREGRWDDSPESQAAARRKVHEWFTPYRMRAIENACYCVYTDQAGRAGYVDALPPGHMNQPHHPGGAMVIDPLGRITACAQLDEIRDEIIIADLDAAVINKARSLPNFTLRTRRPELFGELGE